MKKIRLVKYEFIAPITLSILYFFVVKDVYPKFIYAFIASIIGFYFFPIKLFINKELSTSLLVKRKIITVISIFVFSTIIVLSVVLLLSDSQNIKTTFSIFAILNAILMLLNYFVSEKKIDTSLYIGFMVLVGAISGV